MVPFFFSSKVRRFRMGLLVRLWAARAPACFHAVLKCFLYFKSHRGLLSTYFPL